MARYDSYGTVDDQFAEATDTGFIGFNNRSRPDAIGSGMLTASENARIDIGGIVSTRLSFESMSYPFSFDTNTQFKLEFTLINPVAANTSATSDLSGTTLTLNFTSGHGLSPSFEGVAGLTTASSLTNFTQKTNFVPTYVNSTTLRFTIPALSGVDVGSAVFTVGGPFLQNAQLTEIKTSCGFTKPATNTDGIILVGNSAAFSLNFQPNLTTVRTEIAYPQGTFISGNAEVIQAFDKIMIFEEGQVPLVWDMDNSNDFVNQESGTFTQPVLKSVSTDCTIVNGKVTVTIANTGATALNVGEEIVIVDKGGTGLTVGDEFQIAESSSSNFSFYAAVDDVSGVAIKLIARVSGGAGFTHAPGPRFGIVHQDRLVIPYTNTVDAGANSYTARNVNDEVLISYPFNAEKFDTTYGTFVTAGGSSDRLISAFSFAEDKLILFNRKSIAAVTGINTFNFEGASVSSVTKELGLVAEDSIVQVGNQILFLSDNGIYGASFQDLYNLRGNEIPLSEPIDATIKTINKEHWEKSSAVYFDNRYYISVPTGDSLVNNTLLVYNFLNKNWESVHSVADGGTSSAHDSFDFGKLIVSGQGDARQVYGVGSNGSITRLSYEVPRTTLQGYDFIQFGTGTFDFRTPQIETTLTTRQYTFDDIDRKKFNNYEAVVGSNSQNNNIAFSATFENRDATADLGNISVKDSKGVSIRGRIGNYRAYGAQFTFRCTQQRMSLRQFQVAGAVAFRSTNSAGDTKSA